MNKSLTLLASAALLLASSFATIAAPFPIDAPPSQTIDAADVPPRSIFDAAARTEDGRIQVMVELLEPSAAIVYANTLGGASPTDRVAVAAAGAASQAQVMRIQQAQAQIAPQLTAAAIGGQEIYRVTKALNGIAIAVQPDALSRIAAIPGVKRIVPIIVHYPTSSTSVPFIKAPQVWANTIGLPTGYDGTGVRIGVIDTGIDYMHAAFGGPGNLADYQNESTATTNFTTAGGLFPSAKVVGGWDFAGDAYIGGVSAFPDPNPMDCNGHGSHVAGTAAGFGVTAAGLTFGGPYDGNDATYAPLRIAPGSAPKALLYGLRVFGCYGGTSLTTAAIDWAMDPNGDNDLSDHLDIINMSLGSNNGTAVDASSLAVDNAVKAGVIVVMSAGNAGDTYFIAGSPGVATRGIATASTLDSGENLGSVQVNSPNTNRYQGGLALYGPTSFNVTGTVVIGLDGVGTATDACTALTNAGAMAGNICMVDRGTCNIKVKTESCQNAGAIGMLLVENAPGTPAGGIGDDPAVVTPITIPSLRLSLSEGNALKALVAGGLNVTMRTDPGGDTVSSFSSRGPRIRYSAGTALKPDIAAPGTNIVSVQTGHTCPAAADPQGRLCTGVADPTTYNTGNKSLTISGTSMASPHVAGVMALLRQQHPDWSVEELKALVMNYATHDLTRFGNGGLPRYAPSRIGAGRVDASTAALGSVIAMNSDDSGLVSVAFGPEVNGVVSRTKTIRLVNKGTTSQTFDVGVDVVVDSPGVAFSLPGGSTVTIPASSSTEIKVRMDANSAQMKKNRDPATYPTQGVQANYGDLPRAFMSEEAGYVTFSQSGNLKLRIPVYMAEKAASNMSAPSTIVTGAAPTGSTTIPLSGTDLCTGTLGAGPTCTGVFPTDLVSLVTPFELQVVSPRNPVSAPDYADIRYAGAAYYQPGGSRSLTNDLIMFGVASWGDWSTPNQVAYNICVDVNNDGVYDRAIINTSPHIFVSGASATDTPVRVSQNLSTGSFSILGLGSSVNLVAPSVIDTGVHESNAMVLGATPGDLGFASTAVTTMRYKVITCPGFNPACARTTTGDRCSPTSGFFDNAAGPYFYDFGAQGLNFGGSFLASDLNGAALPVTWNTANMTTNNSSGALLIHHQNGASKRAQVSVLDTALASDIGVTITPDAAAPAVGGNVVFTITATNNGPTAAANVVVFAEVPVGLAYVSDDGGGTYAPASGLWTIPALLNGASAVLKVTAQVSSSGQIDMVAEVSASTPININSANDRATASISAPRTADLDLTASANVASATVGSPITYTLTLKNNGGDPAYGISVQEAFPAFPALQATSHMASQGVFSPATGIWNIGGLGVGASATLSFTVNAPGTAGAMAMNASVTTNAQVNPGDAIDTVPGNNSKVVNVGVLSPATVTATKTVSGTYKVGGTVVYTVTLSNSGPFDQQNNPTNEFVDVLPAGVTLASATATAGTAVATVGTNTVTWNGVVPAGGSVTITINATVNSAAVGTTVSNQGQANYDADGDGTNEANAMTDDPSVGGSSDPTTFNVISFKVEKTWVNGKAGDQATVSASFPTPASVMSTAAGNNTTTGTAVSVLPGDTGAITETVTGGGLNYQASLSCTGNTNALSGDSLTISASDVAVVCTMTNTRKQASLTLKKQWQSGTPGDTATVVTTGFTNNASSGASVSAGNNATTGSPVVVYAGEVGTISESFSVGNSNAYRAQVACTGNATPLTGSTLTISPADSSIVCTLTNSPRTKLTVRKAWVNGINGDTATVVSSGFANNASTGPSVSAGSNTTTSPTVFVNTGDTGTITETFNTGSAANYNSTLSCSGNSTPLSGNTLTVALADSNIVCTMTNARKAATLTLRKTWVNGRPGDRAVVSASGFSEPISTGESVSSGNNTTTSSDVGVVYPGQTGTISEALTVGDTANYTSTLACTGNATPLNGNALTVSQNDTAIVCTMINTRKSATLTLRKTWVNGVVGHVATVSSSGFANNATSGASTSSGNNSTTGAAVNVYAGDSGTITETFGTGNANVYAAVLSCTGNANPVTGNSGLVVSPNDSAIVCTITNTAKSAMSGTKAATGSFQPGSKLTYTIVLTNAGPGVQADNPGPELVDVLPASVTLVSATASAGLATANVNTNTVSWNGSVAVGDSVVITITAKIPAATALGTTISNQASILFDADQNGTNEAQGVTDDPTVAGNGNVTTITVRATLDVDDSGVPTQYDALTDGLTTLRYLFGLTGQPMVQDSIGLSASRTDAGDIKTYLDLIRSRLDIDGDGTSDALTDGVLLLRYMFGINGNALTSGAVGPSATRTTPADISAYIQTLMP